MLFLLTHPAKIPPFSFMSNKCRCPLTEFFGKMPSFSLLGPAEYPPLPSLLSCRRFGPPRVILLGQGLLFFPACHPNLLSFFSLRFKGLLLPIGPSGVSPQKNSGRLSFSLFSPLSPVGAGSSGLLGRWRPPPSVVVFASSSSFLVDDPQSFFLSDF